MAKSRKDKRGYALRTGESQRPNGTYSYSYTDSESHRHTVYAKTLAEIRKKERQIIRDMEDGLDPAAIDRTTLNMLYDSYISQKYDLKSSTKSNYIYMYDHFVRETFGRRKIAQIKYSDVKRFYYKLLMDKTLKPNTLETIHTQLHPAFQMAVRDGLLRTNPTDGVMAEIKKGRMWERPQRHALTVPQQKAFTEFITNNKEFCGWYPILIVLLGTGMRIGECLGLRWDDLDFENRIISVNHNLTNRPNAKGVSVKHISTTKTRSGERTIPMIDEVYDAFLKEYELQKCMGYESETIDGFSNFVFLTHGGNVVAQGSVNRAIASVIEAYNKQETKAAKEEKREPLLLPHFTAHNLRHTFCTRFCENETNLKVIQSVMGHADITTTMDIYAEATTEKKQEIMTNLQGKIII